MDDIRFPDALDEVAFLTKLLALFNCNFGVDPCDEWTLRYGLESVQRLANDSRHPVRSKDATVMAGCVLAELGAGVGTVIGNRVWALGWTSFGE